MNKVTLGPTKVATPFNQHVMNQLGRQNPKINQSRITVIHLSDTMIANNYITYQLVSLTFTTHLSYCEMAVMMSNLQQAPPRPIFQQLSQASYC